MVLIRPSNLAAVEGLGSVHFWDPTGPVLVPVDGLVVIHLLAGICGKLVDALNRPQAHFDRYDILMVYQNGSLHVVINVVLTVSQRVY